MKTTIYDQRYQSTENYWELKPSCMALKIPELLPIADKKLKVLEIGCGEGGTAIFLAQKGYEVKAFDLSSVGLEKTLENAKRAQVSIQTFQADVNHFIPDEMFDVIFSSGTIQYLRPELRESFIHGLQEHTNPGGIHVLHTFVRKPFLAIAPDAEASEHLWSSGELLMFYRDWKTLHFIEEIKDCNSSGVAHQHAHNRIWSQKPS